LCYQHTRTAGALAFSDFRTNIATAVSKSNATQLADYRFFHFFTWFFIKGEQIMVLNKTQERKNQGEYDFQQQKAFP
jgi:hypothetical protein